MTMSPRVFFFSPDFPFSSVKFHSTLLVDNLNPEFQVRLLLATKPFLGSLS